MATYQRLYNARQDCLVKLDFDRDVGTDPSDSGKKFVTISIKNQSDTLLATFRWWIRLNIGQNEMVETYKVFFTPQG
jgi:hypothetical protein